MSGTRGTRSVLDRIEVLRRMEAEGKLRFLRMLSPEHETGAPRRYVVDYGAGEVTLPGPGLLTWVAGFEAGLVAGGGKRRVGKPAAAPAGSGATEVRAPGGVPVATFRAPSS